ncbi:MAG: FKBP-type peptidyl-prolyl cis-trans isomerase [Acidobacteriota bacterium]
MHAQRPHHRPLRPRAALLAAPSSTASRLALATLLVALALIVATAARADQADPLAAPADLRTPPADAETRPSGLVTQVLREGRGDVRPNPEDRVEVHYTGWQEDGSIFDSSVQRGKSVGLPVDALIAGWAEGLQLMVVGEKRRMWIPGALAYAGVEGRPQGMLVFDVELLAIQQPPKAIPAPPDVAAPPADAEVTRSGLASRVLEAGTGKKSPRKRDSVRVHYTGWTPDGVMFDSSVMRGEPTEFPLRGVIDGWQEGLRLMVEGEKRRLWIPGDLAYDGQEGRPQGMLVFDVELIKILD